MRRWSVEALFTVMDTVMVCKAWDDRYKGGWHHGCFRQRVMGYSLYLGLIMIFCYRRHVC